MKTPRKISFNQPINQCNGKGSGQEFCCRCSIATTRQDCVQNSRHWMYDTPPKFNMLTWNLKMMVSKKNLLFQGVDFQVPCAQLQVCIFTYIYHYKSTKWWQSSKEKPSKLPGGPGLEISLKNPQWFGCCVSFRKGYFATGIWQSRWWFQTCFIFIPIWGRFPFWLIFFWWVENTN